MKHRSRLLVSATCLAMGAGMFTSTSANAEAPADEDLATIVSEEDLGELRGGFTVMGMGITFGADIRTYVDGELMLETVLNWSADGADTVQTAAPGLTSVDVTALENGILSNGSIQMKVGEAPVFLLNDGQTAISHDTTSGVQNTLINTATGLNAVQEVEASLSLSGYESFNADLMADRLGSALDSLVGQAGIGALGN